MQMQDDIHKLKKMMDSVFEKMYVRHLRISNSTHNAYWSLTHAIAS